MQSVDGSTPEANREGGPLCYARKGGAQPGEPKKHKWNGLAHPHVQCARCSTVPPGTQGHPGKSLSLSKGKVCC